jgi:hypothetical protein
MKRSFTTLTDATLITAVVQQGYGEIITDALLEVGIQGSTVHGAMGVGIRERLGALGVAVDAERDVVNVMVSSDEVDRVFERMFSWKVRYAWYGFHVRHPSNAGCHIRSAVHFI